jgi:hypothetical protein
MTLPQEQVNMIAKKMKIDTMVSQRLYSNATETLSKNLESSSNKLSNITINCSFPATNQAEHLQRKACKSIVERKHMPLWKLSM